MPEKRTVPRKKFNLYMRVLNDDTGEILGHMVEISSTGLRLETVGPLPTNVDYYLRIELTPDLGSMPFIIFVARIYNRHEIFTYLNSSRPIFVERNSF